MEASILDLKGRNAIVTGGSLGIGAAIAVKLAENGANVAINYRRHDKEAKDVAKQIEKLGWQVEDTAKGPKMRK